MLQFLQPIWLALMAGMIVPVIIHLWQRKPGKVLKVGSTMLLQSASIKHARSLNLTELLLLLLRCLFVLLLACLLAQPVWQNLLQSNRGKGWVMIPKEQAAATYKHFQPEIDSLLSQGHALHYFHKGFEEAGVSNLGGESSADSAGYWQLLQQLQQELPSSYTVHLFTPASLRKISGPRPATALDLHWHTYTPADSVVRWEALRYGMEKDSTRLIKGESSPAATRYVVEGVKGKEAAPLRIAIYTDQYKPDARYLEAALQAIRQYLGRDIIIENWTETNNASADWVFWLSERPVPSGFKKLLRYDTGKAKPVSTAIGNTNIYLYKKSENTDTLTADWKDATGVLLGHNGDEYIFFSHFDPTYTSLVWDDAFPGMLLDLLMPQGYALHDNRAIDPQQLQPAKGTVGSVNHYAQWSLAKYCWLLLFLVFGWERWLSFRNKKEVAND